MIVGVCTIIGGWILGFGEWQNPGPGFIAVLCGILLSLLSALWLVMTLIKKWGIGPPKKFFSERNSYVKVTLTLFILAVYASLLEKLGFMVSTFMFLISLFEAIEPQSWRLAIVLALIVTILSVFCFQLWLQVQLPEGPFGIYLIKKWIY